jgi:hypothetical protein
MEKKAKQLKEREREKGKREREREREREVGKRGAHIVICYIM